MNIALIQESSMTLARPFFTDPRILELTVKIREVTGKMIEKVDIDSRAGQFTLSRIRAETNNYVGHKFDTVEQEIEAMEMALEGLNMWNEAMVVPVPH